MSFRLSGTKLIINFSFLSILMLFSNNSLSKVFNVNAEYKPASYSDEYGANSFINKDKCNLHAHLCKINDNDYIYSLPVLIDRVPKDTGEKSDKAIFINIKPKKILLTHKQSGEQQEMTLIPTVVGEDLYGLRGINTSSELWSLLKPGGDCNVTKGINYQSYIRVVFLTKNENMSSGCYVGFGAKPQYGSRLAIRNFFLGFRLKTPNPLKMKNGDYTGALDLSFSPEGDVDLGNGSYNASHRFNFKLSVKHQIKVDFPQNSKKISLRAHDGWALGGRNTELRNDITYSLWASSNVNVSLRCQYKFNDSCGIKNKKNHLVGLDVFNLDDGNKRTLLSEKTPQIIKVIKPKIGSKNKILFIVNNKSVASMMNYPGTTYSGNVTIVYDASI